MLWKFASIFIYWKLDEVSHSKKVYRDKKWYITLEKILITKIIREQTPSFNPLLSHTFEHFIRLVIISVVHEIPLNLHFKKFILEVIIRPFSSSILYSVFGISLGFYLDKPFKCADALNQWEDAKDKFVDDDQSKGSPLCLPFCRQMPSALPPCTLLFAFDDPLINRKTKWNSNFIYLHVKQTNLPAPAINVYQQLQAFFAPRSQIDWLTLSLRKTHRRVHSSWPVKVKPLIKIHEIPISVR